MLFAKHGYAHTGVRQTIAEVNWKRYYALVKERSSGSSRKSLPIAKRWRFPSSLDRSQRIGENMLVLPIRIIYGDAHLVIIRLHTGRTHQIRVHFHILVFFTWENDLCGGSLRHGIQRQALFCHFLSFYLNTFSWERQLEISSPLCQMILRGCN